LRQISSFSFLPFFFLIFSRWAKSTFLKFPRTPEEAKFPHYTFSLPFAILSPSTSQSIFPYVSHPCRFLLFDRRVRFFSCDPLLSALSLGVRTHFPFPPKSTGLDDAPHRSVGEPPFLVEISCLAICSFPFLFIGKRVFWPEISPVLFIGFGFLPFFSLPFCLRIPFLSW